MQTKLSDGTVYRIVSNIAILKAYRSNLWWSIPPGSLPMYRFNFQLLFFIVAFYWGLSAGYQPRPQVVDRGTTARYGGQLRYI